MKWKQRKIHTFWSWLKKVQHTVFSCSKIINTSLYHAWSHLISLQEKRGKKEEERNESWACGKDHMYLYGVYTGKVNNHLTYRHMTPSYANQPQVMQSSGGSPHSSGAAEMVYWLWTTESFDFEPSNLECWKERIILMESFS